MSIKFNVNAYKAVEVIVYLANKKPDMTQYYFMKMVFYADKYHINKYGIPITGDNYIKMSNGPVPSFILDAIHLNGSRLTHDIYKAIQESLEFHKRGKLIYTSPKRKADMNFLSKSNIECLDAAFNYCKDKTFKELKDLTHEETSWKEAATNQIMDFSLFVEKNNPDHDAIIADMTDTFGMLVL